MFGLMNPPRNCASSCDNLYDSHRKHYCGTCKTIGQHYGQSARLMLNFDAVFLAELLSLFSKDDTASWQPALQKVNLCWQMPEKNSQDSVALQYAATTNVLLGELKIKDNIGDSGKKRWKMLHRFFSTSFSKAKKQLEDWKVDTNEILNLAKEQEKLEQATPNCTNSIAALLQHYATPTAKITARIFEKGTQVIAQEDAASKMYELGYAYGVLAYILDAFTDLESDISKKEFNPIAVYHHGRERLSEAQLEDIRNLILNQQDTVIQIIKELDIAEAHQISFATRLESSIALELYKERFVPTSMKESLKHRWDSAKEKANNLFCHQSKGLLQLKYYLVVFAVFFAPHATEEILPAESKSMVFSWIGLMTALMGSVAFGIFYNSPREKSKRQLKREERRKRREEKKQENFMKRFFNAIKKLKSNCIGDACDACVEIFFLVVYFGVAAFAVIGAIVGLIGFILLQPWGAILLIIALVSALLVAGFGYFAEFFETLLDSALMIAFIFSIIIAVICIIAIIVAILALLAAFNPFVLAVLIVASVVLLALILMTIFSEVFDYM